MIAVIKIPPNIDIIKIKDKNGIKYTSSKFYIIYIIPYRYFMFKIYHEEKLKILLYY